MDFRYRSGYRGVSLRASLRGPENVWSQGYVSSDTKFWQEFMLQFYSWTVALEKRPWPHKDAFSTYLSTVTIWINIITITITIIISIITIIKLMMRYELVSCIPYRSTYPNISTLFNVTISYILDDRPSCNYPGRPAHCDCCSVALWHQKIGKSCAQQEGSIINKV